MSTDEGKVVDAMPPPPAYYKLFASNAATARDSTCNRAESDSIPPAAPSPLSTGTLTSSSTASSTSTSTLASASTPAKGVNDEFPLQPPPPPGPGETFKMFGMPYSAEPVEEELLPPENMVVPTASQQIDFRSEMKALLNSIMANYGQFMEMLVCAPSRAHEKVSDLETLFVNFHSLLNRYRAHQARHVILERMRSQAEENAAVLASLESAMRDSVSAQGMALACLRPSNGASITTAADAAASAAIGVPMDVVDTGEQAEGTRKSGTVKGNGVGSIEDEPFREKGWSI